MLAQSYLSLLKGVLLNIATDTVQISDKDKRTTLIALLIVFLLAALDMSILSTAMPRIVSELNGLELYAWVTTAYMLASTVLVPIYGKLGDLYGCKLILVIGISIFLLGSALCGISGEFGTLPLLGDGMHQLVIFRAVKGIGGAALFTSAMGIIADLYPPLQRAKFMGLFGAIFGISSIIGPAIGGFLTDYASVTMFGHDIAGWRWVFYANIPLGLVALFMIAFKTPRLNHGSRGPIDFAGAFLGRQQVRVELAAADGHVRSQCRVTPVVHLGGIARERGDHAAVDVPESRLRHHQCDFLRDQHGLPRGGDVHAAVHAGGAWSQRHQQWLLDVPADAWFDDHQHTQWASGVQQR